eukprot:2122286-Amphidinium_carterae.2
MSTSRYGAATNKNTLCSIGPECPAWLAATQTHRHALTHAHTHTHTHTQTLLRRLVSGIGSRSGELT